jgi:hypothetical protein
MEKLPHYYFSWIVSFQKQGYMRGRGFPRGQNGPGKNLPHHRVPGGGGGGGVFLGEISSSKHYSKKEKSRFGRGLGPVIRQNTDE